MGKVYDLPKKEYRFYEVEEVNNLIAMLTDSRDFWKKKCLERGGR